MHITLQVSSAIWSIIYWIRIISRLEANAIADNILSMWLISIGTLVPLLWLGLTIMLR